MKKLLLLMGLCFIPLVGTADEVATDWMILNNVNSQQYSDIWSRFRAGFKLDHVQTDRVKYYEKLYTKNPKNFNRLMANAIPYLYFLLGEVERDGLPSELALIPGIESSYDPLAKNPTDAYAGMWQFIPTTGKRFKMAQNSNIDERRDIVKSTRAALDYFNYLHLMFGQWDVAIGAYNWGEGGMYRAIVNSGMQVGQVEYSNLQLRQITADYVPKIIALASIIENPGKFGVTLDNVPNQPYFALVTPAANASVADVSRLSNVDDKIFLKLNPQYKKASYQLDTSSNLLLPLPNQNIYYANIGQAIVAANGTMLASNNDDVASDSNLKLAALNDVIVGSVAAGKSSSNSGDNPVIDGSSDSIANAKADEHDLDDLVDKLGTQQNTTAAIDSEAAAGTTTAAATQVVLSTPGNIVKYKVNPGDTLYSISKKFNADINQIRSDNHIPGNNLFSGQVLRIKTNSAVITSTM